MRETMAAAYPEPVPTSSTRCPGFTPAAWIIQATTYGWEMVCPSAMGSGMSR